MEWYAWVFMGALIAVIIALIIKIKLLQISANEIKREFQNKLQNDTNTLISVSGQDPYMKELAAAINTGLRQLRSARQRYQQGDLELKDAVTNISHDLRTPLTAICGYLELLKRQEQTEQSKHYISIIENRTDALRLLTEELLRYSIVRSGQDISFETVDLRRSLEDSLISFYGAFQEKNIRPEIILCDMPVKRQLNTSALNRIFSNIISNALKYSDGDFKAVLRSDGTLLFSNRASSLDTVTVGQLFNRYYTVDTAGPSTGLGLSIARHLTEQMGGSISAECQQGRLLITLRFPNS